MTLQLRMPPFSTALVSPRSEEPSNEMLEDRKEGIVSSIRCVMTKRKVVQAMGEPSLGGGGLARSVDASCRDVDLHP